MCMHIVLLLPNRPAEFWKATSMLARHSTEINVLGYGLASEGKLGILHLLCSPHQVAYKALFDHYQYYCSEREVEIVEVEHRPGELASILEILATNEINLPNSYQASTTTGKALIVMEFDSIDEGNRASQLLRGRGLKVLETAPS